LRLGGYQYLSVKASLFVETAGELQERRGRGAEENG